MAMRAGRSLTRGELACEQDSSPVAGGTEKSWSSPSEEVAVLGVERGAGLLGVACGVEEVCVDPQRDGRIGVAELAGDEDGITSLSDEDAGECVAKAVTGHALQPSF